MNGLLAAICAVCAVAAVTCGSGEPSAGGTATSVVTPTSLASVTPSPEVVTATAVPSTTGQTPSDEPIGIPIAPNTLLGAVTGQLGSRTITWGGGPEALAYSREDQPSGDAERANGSGWNCRVHQEYEGQPAVDWYIPPGTPVMSTIDGVATLSLITTSNAFDYYGVSREPYLGNPDRARAPLSPFSGPGGGKGVFVRVVGTAFETEYAHLDLALTLGIVPASAFVDGHSASSNYASFAAMRGYRDATAIAQWSVRRGDVIGLSGDSGYSEGPHLHYTIRRASGVLLCATSEAGFADGGWLTK